MKAYKGFNRDMTCTPNDHTSFLYKEGETYETDEASLCKSGFHACENPLDCFHYYKPTNSVYHEVELDATDETSSDTKRVGKRIKIGARLDVAGICKAHFEYVKEHTTNSKQGEHYSSLSAQHYSSLSARNCSSLSAQHCSSLSAQDYSSLSAQDYSSLSAQHYSSLEAGRDSVLAAFNSKAKAGMGSLIALANRTWTTEGYVITDFAAAIVDGETIKPDTWYECKNGQLVEVEQNADD